MQMLLQSNGILAVIRTGVSAYQLYTINNKEHNTKSRRKDKIAIPLKNGFMNKVKKGEKEISRDIFWRRNIHSWKYFEFALHGVFGKCLKCTGRKQTGSYRLIDLRPTI